MLPFAACRGNKKMRRNSKILIFPPCNRFSSKILTDIVKLIKLKNDDYISTLNHRTAYCCVLDELISLIPSLRIQLNKNDVDDDVMVKVGGGEFESGKILLWGF
jgi:hypothetical protein